MKTWALLLWIGISLIGCSAAPRGDELGNGGDPLPKLFERGRQKALRIVDAVGSLGEKEENAWYQTHREKLKSDIVATPEYRWVKVNNNGACGETGSSLRSPIFLSYDRCRSIETERDAAIHLIGESVHHLGVTRDTFAARLASALAVAWDRELGLTEPAIQTRIHFEFGKHYVWEHCCPVRCDA